MSDDRAQLPGLPRQQQHSQHQQQAALPPGCAYCGRPLLPDEDSIVLMREGTPVAAYHERCHPHHRRRGCSGC